MNPPVNPQSWLRFASAVLERAGLPVEPAAAVAAGLVEADLYGHSTHGLALLSDYVDEIAAGTMTVEGRPAVLADAGAAVTWDARRLPGIWTTMLAVDEAVVRANAHGLGAVAIRNSHHIACLAAYLEAPARAGSLVLIFSSDPGAAHVAPFGGGVPVLTPDPIAAGIPAEPDPILIDVSVSITTAGMVAKMDAAGGRMKGRWLIDRDGRPTDDPSALKQGGAILPIGGLDHGHKGFALGLLVEALTQGLSGYGRADAPRDWGAGVLVLAFAPSRFAGEDATDAENLARLMAELGDVPEGDARRRARFRCVIVMTGGGGEIVAEGTVEGRITTEPRGRNGFGYDPVFVPEEGDGRTFAEMAPFEKHVMSHRGRALAVFVAALDAS